MDMNNIDVAIVEDDSEIRQALTLIIDGSPGFSCKLSFNDCESSLEAIESSTPDVVLMDINLPGISGIEGVRKLKEKIPDTDFIMLTIQEDNDSIFNSICAGATGYLLKDTPPAELLKSIKDVYEGGSPMSPSIARRIVSSFKTTIESPLTAREKEVLQRLCDGENYKTIADALYISGNTVRAHIKKIYSKLQVQSRAGAVKKAIGDRLI